MDPLSAPKIGSGLKSRPKKPPPEADTAAVAAAGKAHGFDRSTGVVAPVQPQRRGRPSPNEVMTYWRVYVSAELREALNELRDEKGRELDDVSVKTLAAYRESKT